VSINQMLHCRLDQ